MAFPRNKFFRALLIAIFLTLIAFKTHAFALLGPLAPWMTPSVGFIKDPAYDVGGPRDLNDEFRWNLPVLTYGFSDDFQEFFGPQGVAEVEAAIAILNNLPPASQINLSNAPLATARINASAGYRNLYDLRSTALGYLLEQMGLASPFRSVWVNSDPNAPERSNEFDSFPNDYILQRNFDPFTLDRTSRVDGIRLTYIVQSSGFGTDGPYPPDLKVSWATLVDQTQSPYYHPVADTLFSPLGRPLGAGQFTPALTQDDLGGLRYLLHTNNINVEPIIPGARAHDPFVALVNIAPRPGVDHIQFQRFDPGASSITNVFDDKFFENGVLKTQKMERVISGPDILFTAENHKSYSSMSTGYVNRIGPNFSHNETNGPGIFFPGVVISFEKFGDIYQDPYYYNAQTGDFFEEYWGTFNNGSTNQIVYPVGSAYQTGRTISTHAIVTDAGRYGLEWTVRLILGENYAVDDSTNLVNWTTDTNFTAQLIQKITNTFVWPTPQFFRIRRLPSQ